MTDQAPGTAAGDVVERDMNEIMSQCASAESVAAFNRTYNVLATQSAEIVRLREALSKVASHKGQTLISVEHGQPYSIGANAAFEDLAAIARAALVTPDTAREGEKT